MNTIKLWGAILFGNLSAKNLNFVVAAGPRPAAGDYHLRALKDGAFGEVAVLSPRATARAPVTGRGLNAWDWGNRGGSAWDWGNKAGGNAWDWGNRGDHAWDWGNKGSNAWDWGAAPQSSTAWWISGSIIPGRNCLIIPSGFAEFMSALAESGQATLSVR